MWQVVEGADEGRSVTEWLAVPGGRLYRTVWEHDPQGEHLTPIMKGSSVVFVPDPNGSAWATAVEQMQRARDAQ